MLRSSSLIGGVLAVLLSACGDDGSVDSEANPTPQADPSTDPASGGPPVTTGGTVPVTSVTEDAGSASMSASQGTAADPGSTSTIDPATTRHDPHTSANSSTGSSATSGDDTTTTGGPVETGVVRFIAFGDTGEGNEDQYTVAEAIVNVCALKGCDFGMLLGDNFYDSGVSGVDDPQWQDKFELPYADLTFPIYAVLGNHDYGSLGFDFDTAKPDYQVEYTQMSEIWRMPSKYYAFKQEHVEFWGLDTNQIMTDPINGSSDPQQNWFDQGVAGSTATWKIAFGHHPYISNGDHGNAGTYENIEGIPLPFVTGETVKDFMDQSFCGGKIDMYLSGHDHNLQWLEPACGVEYIVSGAGSKAEPLPGQNPVYFAQPDTEGFLWVEIKDNSFTGVFYDKAGAELYIRTINK